MIHTFRCNACKGTYDETDRHGILNPHACGPLPADKKNPERERPDKRDENARYDRGGRLLGIKSEGAGVTCLTDGKIEQPQWLSALYKRVADLEEKENA